MLDKVQSGFADVEILHGITMNANERDLTLITGPNGAGKSTLLASIMGVAHVMSGEVLFGGKRITNMATSRITRMGISYMPQESNIFPNSTVRENLELGGYLLHGRSEMEERMREVISYFPFLEERLHTKAGLLSGGEAQMLAIGCAIFASPKLLLLDEPTSGLDQGKRSIMLKELTKLNESGVGIVLVEQNVAPALEVADYFYVMVSGRVVAEGVPSNSDATAISRQFFQK